MVRFDVGTQLGPYEILGALGSGGMGTVYRARDSRLGRDVAIKCVSPELSADAASRARIEREARSVAALSHPNICTLHDVGTHEGSTYLVMELLEGETLATRISRTRGGLPVAEALAIAAQVSDALAYAHRHQIVHRDLKPANIMLTATGARLLDFGLAKARERDAAGDAKTQSVLTAPHEVLGTQAYMSPEQLEGRADERSDIFALGAVLFEMLTGSHAFAGDSSPALIAAIVNHEPPSIETLRPDVPASIARITKRCLAKTPDRRWQSAADLAEELRWASEPSSGAPRTTSAPWPWRMLAALAVLVAVAAVGVAVWPRRDVPTTAHLAFLLPGVQPPTYGAGIAISPDGSTIAIAAGIGTGSSGPTHLFVKRLDAPDVELIPGTERARWPFFSPDGKSVAFYVEGSLKQWSASTRSVTTIAPVRGGSMASWTTQGDILLGEQADTPKRGVGRLSASGGALEILTQPDAAKGEQEHFAPHRLDDGRVLFTIRRNGPNGAEYDVAVRGNSGDVAILIPGASLAVPIGGGRLVYQLSETLMLASLDLSSLALSNARQLADDVAVTRFGAQWAVGNNVLVYRSVDPPRRRLVWVDRSGVSVPTGLPVRDYLTPAISPSGDRLAVMAERGDKVDFWMADLRQQTSTLVSPGLATIGPIWSADASRVFAARSKGAGREIIAIRADQPQDQRSILDTGEQLFVADMSPDQRQLVIMKPTDGNRDIWLLDVASGQLRPIVQLAGTQYGGRVSPDGKWLSYFSFSAGEEPQLFVTPFPGGGASRQVSRKGAREAVWSRDGKELFYREQNRMLSVTIKPGPQFDWEPPRTLFTGDYFIQGGPGVVQYDVAADGRFLMIEEAPLGSASLKVILNWQQLAR